MTRRSSTMNYEEAQSLKTQNKRNNIPASPYKKKTRLSVQTPFRCVCVVAILQYRPGVCTYVRT